MDPKSIQVVKDAFNGNASLANGESSWTPRTFYCKCRGALKMVTEVILIEKGSNQHDKIKSVINPAADFECLHLGTTVFSRHSAPRTEAAALEL